VLLSGNPNAITLLENNLDKVDWWMLSANPNAITLLERKFRQSRLGELSQTQMLSQY
jgi:hypothetical protein